MTSKKLNQVESSVFYLTQGNRLEEYLEGLIFDLAIAQDPYFALAYFVRGNIYHTDLGDSLQVLSFLPLKC